jgi:hypothetical protein
MHCCIDFLELSSTSSSTTRHVANNHKGQSKGIATLEREREARSIHCKEVLDVNRRPGKHVRGCERLPLP